MDSKERYSRQIQLPEIGLAGQKRLDEAKVLIVGVGGLGCSAAQHLVMSGIGTLGLADHDVVDITNLNRQILFTEQDRGEPKVKVAQRALQKLNKRTRIITYQEPIDYHNALSVFMGYDLIIDGTDKFQTKYVINDVCVQMQKPWVYASIYKYQGQLSVFNFRGGPTYRCLYPAVNPGAISCEEAGVLGVLPGLVGTMQAVEAIKVILQLGQVISGKLLVVDLLSMQQQSISFNRDEKQVEKAKKQRHVQFDPANSSAACRDIYLDVRDLAESPVSSDKTILHIPLDQLGDRHAEIPREVPIYVYCQSGIKSEKAVRLLSEQYGFRNLINVKGGIQSLVQ